MHSLTYACDEQLQRAKTKTPFVYVQSPHQLKPNNYKHEFSNNLSINGHDKTVTQLLATLLGVFILSLSEKVEFYQGNTEQQ